MHFSKAHKNNHVIKINQNITESRYHFGGKYRDKHDVRCSVHKGKKLKVSVQYK